MTTTVDGTAFWDAVDVRGEGECWPWTRGRQGAGYGVHWVARVAHLAHRTALELTDGPGPDGAHALHSCDNPGCCNPAHLRWGTHADNMRDMRDRGRAKPGRTLPAACSAGHDLTDPTNVLTKTRRQQGRVYTVRTCRECNRIYLARRRAQKKGA